MEKKNLSIGFADVEDFGKAAGSLSDEAIMAALNSIYQKIGDIIVAHRGTIRKYSFDEIMFTFSRPQDAIQAGREIAANARLTIENSSLRVCVSIATGEAVVGQIGHPSMPAEEVFGRVVNQAACLMKDARSRRSGLAMCEETARHLQGGNMALD